MKNSDTLNLLEPLKEILMRERPLIKLIVIYAVTVGLFSLALPLATQSLVNTVAFGTVLQPIVVLTFAVIFFLTLSAVLKSFQVLCAEFLQRRIFVYHSLKIAHHLPLIQLRSAESAGARETVNRYFDIFLVQKAAASLMMDGVTIGLQTLIGLFVLAFYHPLLLAFDFLLLGALYFVGAVLGKGALDTAIAESSAKYEMAAWLEELARLPMSFRSHQQQLLVQETADQKANVWLNARESHFFRVFRQTAGTLGLQVVASGALLGFGGWLVIQKQLSLGQLVAAELIVSGVVMGVAKLGKQFESYYDLVAGLNKIEHILHIPTERAGGEEFKCDKTQGLTVQLTDVAYVSPDSARKLGPVSLDFAPGACTLIYGPPASGKSEFVDLLSGYLTPSAGRIEFGSQDLRFLDLPSFREHIRVVRDIEVIEDSIETNLRFAHPHATAEEMRETLKRIGLWEEIAALPQGIKTQLDPWGHPLSSVQVRRLMIAKAILPQPSLLILDKSSDAAIFADVGNLLRELCVLAKDPEHPMTLFLFTDQKLKIKEFDRSFEIVAGAWREISG